MDGSPLSLFMRGRTLQLLLDSPVMMEGLGLLDYKVLIPRMPTAYWSGLVWSAPPGLRAPSEPGTAGTWRYSREQ